ncbi:hypothetical protein Nepgr_011633 [Nepenthes gracilis]|uniref:Uncharacterized protein n=1 Tax=Nepenthes gracilis TaxID=150966 RepID=A0AAD3XM49_NEPGR|nr:hypothetical protein Nepgr_011633 [Nepenthes gracilis]
MSSLHEFCFEICEVRNMGLGWVIADWLLRIGLRSKLLSAEDAFVKIRSEDPFVRAVMKLDAIKQSLDCRMEAQGAVEVVSSCYGAKVI